MVRAGAGEEAGAASGAGGDMTRAIAARDVEGARGAWRDQGRV
jgi:hypothetical protein